MKDVVHVPGMTSNLVVVSALEDEGYDVLFSRGRVYIQKYGSSERFEIGIRDGGLYRLTAKLLKALVHDTISSIELWHRRLAHLHYRVLPPLRKVSIGLPEFGDQHSGVCRGCALGKNDERPFQSNDSKAKGILDLIHSDLCGPMFVDTFSEFSYFITFIDDYSWKTWIYFLKSKESDEVLDRFKEFKALVENQTGRRIRVLRSDNGSEYISGGFIDFCSRAGIKTEFTLPYNP